METWDQSKLESVVAEKHGEKVAKQTDIVCKHFLDAIERSLYGWFWVCPNGGAACKYRHALPPGYVFKTRAEREAEKSKKVEEISIEEIIEQQRAKLGPSGGTPVTAESLARWKADKIKRKKVEEEKRRKEEMKKSGGRGISTCLHSLRRVCFQVVLMLLCVSFVSLIVCALCSEWSCVVHLRSDVVP